MILQPFRTMQFVVCFFVAVTTTSESSFPQDANSNRPGSQRPIENVVLITLDGLRGEEVFTGADKRLISKESGVKNVDTCVSQYWRDDPVERRRVLMPSLWDRIENHGGWIAGNSEEESLVRVTNGLFFSYPGYNEILSGFADPWVNSNDKRYNKNTTVLEWLHQQGGLQGRISAYTSWDVFPFIINDQRSKIPVNAGWMPLAVGSKEKTETANFIASQLFHEFDGVRYDAITTVGALEEIKTNKPRVLFVSLGETDDWAHAGRYDLYLLTAQQNDRFLAEIWETTQAIEQYKDKTLFIVTTDHGRGDGREGWKNHSVLLAGSERIWVAAWGVPLYVSGIDHGGKFTQSQVAPTIAAALGYNFKSTNPKIANPLPIIPEVAEKP
jgi:hypothetical protein